MSKKTAVQVDGEERYSVSLNGREMAKVTAPSGADALNAYMTIHHGKRWRTLMGVNCWKAGVHKIWTPKTVSQSRETTPTGIDAGAPTPLVSITGRQWYR